MDGKKLEYKGEEALKEIERLTMKASEVQENLLKQILTHNRETEYLNKFMRGEKNITEFKSFVPVTTYERIFPYIQRIANGEDSSLITGHQITEMLCRYVPDLDEGKAMYLFFVKAEMSTPCGLPARTVLTSYYKSKHFKCRTHDPWNDYTSPDQTILCNDSNQSMHCQLLAGLVHRRQVLRLGAVFASAFLRAISFLERNWRQLCEDIRSGKLSSFITDPSCRSCMSTVLSTPDPRLADEITRICSQNSWKGILCQLWPKAKYIEAVVTGSMAQYVPALKHYSDGKLPLVCTMYASSECYFGVNLKPLCDPGDVAFTLLPNMGYFEFLPLGHNGKLLMDFDEGDVPNDKLVDLVHVKLGCFYEPVVTTFAGLYRYRVGDVLQVVGFHNNAPQVRFICRRNVVISVDTEKTNEEDLHRSVTMAKKLLEPYDGLLVEYTSYPDTSSVPGHYVLYWEILYCGIKTEAENENAVMVDGSVLEECCIAVEEQLDYVYRRCRSHDKSVGPLEIRVVEPGTFDSLMDLFISQGASINQYKTPRCIKSKKALKLLNSKVTASFFSPRDPKWVPKMC
ncbi:putative indole-3-acetic acid-amido synthetase GH3.9 isoform X2 [Vigna radiata var. radiata]|uniref:Indole-3-acetic acid-amido synthetase GH3.9 isoform X2 n=1 Tax=Vigna radiata var. radiata TaxID=3916 RepID=A0A1S3V3W6_VIGRR|nr:putative indole-3-acetic acid-amido synthetase GH3.9 isoform X2 [Vigna radiata var. radiata]